MEPLRIPSEAEMRATHREGEDAVVKPFYETLDKLAEHLQRLEDQITKTELIHTQDTEHFDETGGRIGGKFWWLHVVCTALLTFYAPHRKRGCEPLDAIGIFPAFKGEAIHDGYHSYFQYEDVLNALCNAHHQRDLIFIRDQYQQNWAAEMIKLLLEIKAAVEEAPPEQQCLLPTQLNDLETRYDAIQEAGLQTCPVLDPAEPLPKKRGKPKQHPVKNLLDFLRSRKTETLAFMVDFKVPIDNNQVERDLRMVKLK